jgi:hypothetical protein
MNIAQAKQIPLIDILEKLGHTPVRKRGHDHWYLSPWREEKRASFHVHAERNICFDFGDGKGGNALDFACRFLEARGQPYSVANGLKFLSDLMGKGFTVLPITAPLQLAKEETRLELVSLKAVKHPALVQYLQSRGLNVDIARLYLKEAAVRNKHTGKRFFSLAFTNEDDGYELRTPFFKSAIAPKAITFIRGSVPKPEGIHVFEGWPDFLTVLTRQRAERLRSDAISLNSVSMLESALPFIKGYGYEKLHSWMHNDVAGSTAIQKLSAFVRAEEGLMHHCMNKIYAPHKDLNAWHMHNLGL